MIVGSSCSTGVIFSCDSDTDHEKTRTGTKSHESALKLRVISRCFVSFRDRSDAAK